MEFTPSVSVDSLLPDKCTSSVVRNCETTHSCIFQSAIIITIVCVVFVLILDPSIKFAHLILSWLLSVEAYCEHQVIVSSPPVRDALHLEKKHVIVELSRARSGAPWVTKFGKLPIRENLVMTQHTPAPAYQCLISHFLANGSLQPDIVHPCFD